MKCPLIFLATPSLSSFGVAVADITNAESPENIVISLLVNNTLYECSYDGMERNTEYNCTANEWVITESVCDLGTGFKLIAENAGTNAVFIDTVFIYYEGTKYLIDAFCMSDEHSSYAMASYSPDSCDSGYSAWDTVALDSNQMWTTKAVYFFDLEDSDISYDALVEDASDWCIVPDSCSCPTEACTETATTSDFDSSPYNGLFEEYGTCNGQISYKHVDRALYLFSDERGSATIMDKRFCDSTVTYYYYGDDTMSWFSYSSGAAVAGSITYNHCSITNESPTTSPTAVAPPTTSSPTTGSSLFRLLFFVHF